MDSYVKDIIRDQFKAVKTYTIYITYVLTFKWIKIYFYSKKSMYYGN